MSAWGGLLAKLRVGRAPLPGASPWTTFRLCALQHRRHLLKMMIKLALDASQDCDAARRQPYRSSVYKYEG